MSNKTKKYLISTAIYILLATFVCWNEPLTTNVRLAISFWYVVWMILSIAFIELSEQKNT